MAISDVNDFPTKKDAVIVLTRAILQSEEERKALNATPEFQEQGRLARNWIDLVSLAGWVGKYKRPFCPKCGKTLEGFSCCGLSLDEMAELAGDKMHEHSAITCKVQKEIQAKFKIKWDSEETIKP